MVLAVLLAVLARTTRSTFSSTKKQRKASRDPQCQNCQKGQKQCHSLTLPRVLAVLTFLTEGAQPHAHTMRAIQENDQNAEFCRQSHFHPCNMDRRRPRRATSRIGSRERARISLASKLRSVRG